MWSWLITTGIAVTAIVLVCCLPASQRSETGPRKHRFAAIRSPLIERPAFRILFLLVVVGVLLISMLPEAVFVLPALDAVGLDIATILVALELRHYLASAARLAHVPPFLTAFARSLAPVARRGRDVMRTHPALWEYASVWPLIWLRTFLGKQ